jgi:hypothetical protein
VQTRDDDRVLVLVVGILVVGVLALFALFSSVVFILLRARGGFFRRPPRPEDGGRFFRGVGFRGVGDGVGALR